MKPKSRMYRANFTVNNGTRLAAPLEGTNFRRLKREITAAAKANFFQSRGNTGSIWIEDESGREMYCGVLFLSQSGNVFVRWSEC